MYIIKLTLEEIIKRGSITRIKLPITSWKVARSIMKNLQYKYPQTYLYLCGGTGIFLDIGKRCN